MIYNRSNETLVHFERSNYFLSFERGYNILFMFHQPYRPVLTIFTNDKTKSYIARLITTQIEISSFLDQKETA